MMSSVRQLQPYSSTVVSFEAHKFQRPINFVGEITIEEQDNNEYVFEVAKNEDGSLLAAALSSRSVSIYDTNMNLVTNFQGHGGTVNDVMFVGNDVVMSACEDKFVRG
jgi:WD40 repeat protein